MGGKQDTQLFTLSVTREGLTSVHWCGVGSGVVELFWLLEVLSSLDLDAHRSWRFGP